MKNKFNFSPKVCMDGQPSTAMVVSKPRSGPEPSLLGIPGELRNLTWRMLLTTRWAFQEHGYETDDECRYDLQPALLRVNRQTYTETRGILYEENYWTIASINQANWPQCYNDEASHLPVVSRKTAPSTVPLALTIGLEIPGKYEQVPSDSMSRFQSMLQFLQVERHFPGRTSRSTRPATRLSGQQKDSTTLIMWAESLPHLCHLRYILNCKDPATPSSQKPACFMHWEDSRLFGRTPPIGGPFC